MSDIEALNDEIVATRQALKETAAALAAKADIKRASTATQTR